MTTIFTIAGVMTLLAASYVMWELLSEVNHRDVRFGAAFVLTLFAIAMALSGGATLALAWGH